MNLFKSNRERRLWFFVLIVQVAIYASLGVAPILAKALRDRDMISNGFWVGLILVVATVIVHGLKTRANKAEIMVWLGIAGVYLLVFLRMVVNEERGHIIEYSVVAVFIHEALKERASQDGHVRRPALLAILATTVLGILDECIQAFLPNRVFDPPDMLFNTGAALMAIGSSLALTWARTRISNVLKKKGEREESVEVENEDE